MRASLALWGLAGMALTLPESQSLAQNGVLSGPPQIRKDGRPPDSGPGGGQNWIAVVGGFDGNGRKVSIGYSGLQRSRSEAENAAVKACIRNEASAACRDPYAVSSGCLYIVPGTRLGGGVTWGRGSTRAAAFDECRRGGYACPDEKLIGGCVPGTY
ncbi:MAG TPA: DUF4189 domain-containing protein [Hyphomicrobiaceae bacterium]